MNTALVTAADVGDALARLGRVYDNMTVDEEVVAEWVGVMQRGAVTFDALRVAVDQYLDANNRSYPKPGAIRALAKAAELEMRVSEQTTVREDDDGRICTSCGRRFYFAGLEVGPKRTLCCALKCGCRDNRTGWRHDLDPWPEGFPIPGEEAHR